MASPDLQLSTNLEPGEKSLGIGSLIFAAVVGSVAAYYVPKVLEHFMPLELSPKRWGDDHDD